MPISINILRLASGLSHHNTIILIITLFYVMMLAVISYSSSANASTISDPINNMTTSNGTNPSMIVGPPRVVESKPTANYTTTINGTLMSIGPPRESQPEPRPIIGNEGASNNVINIPNINITKEQAVKAEQDANVMIKAYYEKLEQGKQKEREAAALAAAAAGQSNETAEAEAEAEETLDDTETDTEEEEEEGEGQENEDENGNENGENEGEDDE